MKNKLNRLEFKHRCRYLYAALATWENKATRQDKFRYWLGQYEGYRLKNKKLDILYKRN